MRSIVLHLWKTDHDTVARALDIKYPGQKQPWVCFVDGDACLYIDFYHDGPREDELWATKFDCQGGPPVVSVIANISGRHDGWPQVQELVAHLFGRFDGLTEDDCDERLWSREEIEQNQRPNGNTYG